MGFLDKLGGTDLSKIIFFMFAGLVVAILLLGFHHSPQAAPAKYVGSTGGATPNQYVPQPSSVNEFTLSQIP